MSLDAIAAAAEARRRELVLERERREARLPLRFLRQQAHFTCPASDAAMVEKAVTLGHSPTRRILERLGIATDALARELGVAPAELESVLEGDARAPLTMVDGEDAQALVEATVRRGRENAARAFRELDWGRSLRFYRPSGLELEFATGDLASVLGNARRADGSFAIDGIVWPKVEHARELEWLLELLRAIEREVAIPENSIKLELLIESAVSLENLKGITETARERLVGLIFGIADYSADVGLPEIRNDHPVCDIARAAIVNAAGAAGVPAVDAMTMSYPVARKDLSPDENRRLVTARLVECHRDARHGIELGMSGKWVGHPAQLAIVTLAFRRALGPDVVEREIAKVEAYRGAVAREVGATMIGETMTDRATDRHTRAMLRRAAAWGALDARRAEAAGLISASERAELERG